MPLLPACRVRLSILSLLGGLGLLAPGCTPAAETTHPDALMQNDFEHLDGWLGNTPSPSLTREHAHSGHYAIKVDADLEYSLTYTTTLGQLSRTRPRQLQVEAWVFVPRAGAGALLVTHLGDAPPATKPLLWDGFDVVAASHQLGQWVHVSRRLAVPPQATADTNFGIYLWRNQGREPVYLDDLVVTKPSS